jgi:hypothetical protein
MFPLKQNYGKPRLPLPYNFNLWHYCSLKRVDDEIITFWKTVRVVVVETSFKIDILLKGERRKLLCFWYLRSFHSAIFLFFGSSIPHLNTVESPLGYVACFLNSSFHVLYVICRLHNLWFYLVPPIVFSYRTNAFFTWPRVHKDLRIRIKVRIKSKNSNILHYLSP